MFRIHQADQTRQPQDRRWVTLPVWMRRTWILIAQMQEKKNRKKFWKNPSRKVPSGEDALTTLCSYFQFELLQLLKPYLHTPLDRCHTILLVDVILLILLSCLWTLEVWKKPWKKQLLLHLWWMEHFRDCRTRRDCWDQLGWVLSPQHMAGTRPWGSPRTQHNCKAQKKQETSPDSSTRALGLTLLSIVMSTRTETTEKNKRWVLEHSDLPFLRFCDQWCPEAAVRDIGVATAVT